MTFKTVARLALGVVVFGSCFGAPLFAMFFSIAIVACHYFTGKP